MTVVQRDIQHSIRSLGLSGHPICLHSSLRSFGQVEGGAEVVVAAFLQEQCTLLVPTFSWTFAVPPPLHLRPPRNGWNYPAFSIPTPGSGGIYRPACPDIDREMGAIPVTVVGWPKRARGNHPLCSFAAVGPLAGAIIADQSPLDVFAPLSALAQRDGTVLLAGVGLDKMTLLHLAEKVAGRTPFRRWAHDCHGQPMTVEVGSCSNGFANFEPYLQAVLTSTLVGQSEWKAYPARQALHDATVAIQANPSVTHCSEQTCERCNDAVAGGPILFPHYPNTEVTG